MVLLKVLHVRSTINTRKITQTLLSRYGVDHPSLILGNREKLESRCLKLYGVKHHTQHTGIKAKVRNTCSKRYVGGHPLRDPSVQQTRQENYLEKSDGKYIHHSQDPEVQLKKRDNYLVKSGGKYTNPMQDPGVFNRVKRHKIQRSNSWWKTIHPTTRIRTTSIRIHD